MRQRGRGEKKKRQEEKCVKTPLVSFEQFVAAAAAFLTNTLLLKGKKSSDLKKKEKLKQKSIMERKACYVFLSRAARDKKAVRSKPEVQVLNRTEVISYKPA